MDQALLVLTNVPDLECAQLVARTLIESRLAACVNLLPAVQSMYRWQGQIEEATEVTLLIKTTSQHYDSVQQAIVKLHPYNVPEIIATPIVAGYTPYLHWIDTETAKENNA
ncbi:MAG: divalent-cation tolerance protein CutA [Sulfuritalea sp.]|nr:divalent-cation tolerance protein CutA [Polynucleobacter sp.]MCF8187926.1 divalent-cation tolerance protein CutA [Sulfuritalea sp.]